MPSTTPGASPRSPPPSPSSVLDAPIHPDRRKVAHSFRHVVRSTTDAGVPKCARRSAIEEITNCCEVFSLRLDDSGWSFGLSRHETHGKPSFVGLWYDACGAAGLRVVYGPCPGVSGY